MIGTSSYPYSSGALEDPQSAYLTSETSKNTRIADEKRARKAVEEDAARLQNRVQTLQKEDQKAQKRLEETRLKAQDLLALRARNEQKQLEREERYRQQQVRTRAHSWCNVSRLTVPVMLWSLIQESLSASTKQLASCSLYLCKTLKRGVFSWTGRTGSTAARLWQCQGDQLQEEGQSGKAELPSQDVIS